MDAHERPQEDDEVAAAAAMASPARLRLHVGGLAPSVTPHDVEKTFGAFGCVVSVEIVRTKGRSFGYLDFEAASVKDLQRLFSLYNGCLWKGGRLRVEKAREHYVERLHREWAEDAAESRNPPKLRADSNNAFTPSTRPEPWKGLKIFVPKLGKVKQSSERGFGKHKYSFQHVDSLPLNLIQVCDCEYCSKRGICVSIGDNEKMAKQKGRNNIHQSDRKATTYTEKSGKDSDDVVENNFTIQVGEQEVVPVDEATLSPYKLKKLPYVNVPSKVCKARDINGDSWNGCKLGHSSVPQSGTVTSKHVRFNLDSVKPIEDTGKSLEQNEGEKVEMFNVADSIHVQAVSEGANSSIQTQQVGGNSWVQSLVGECGKINSPEGQGNGEKVEMDDSTHGKAGAASDIHSSVQAPQVNNWVQKASWKTLVGETGRLTFTLNDIMDFNSTQQPGLGISQSNDLQSVSNFCLSPAVTNDAMPIESKSKVNLQSMRNLRGPEGMSLVKDVLSKPDLGTDVNCSEVEDCAVVKPLKRRLASSLQDTRQQVLGTLAEDNTHIQAGLQTKQIASSRILDDGKKCAFMRSVNANQEWLESKRQLKDIVKTRRKEALRSLKKIHKNPIEM